MAALVRELKDFLLKNLYRHYRVVRMGDKAGRILRDLFAAYAGEPLQLPPRYQARIERTGIHRVVCDYIAGHDRPLRARRAPQALRSRSCGSEPRRMSARLALLGSSTRRASSPPGLWVSRRVRAARRLLRGRAARCRAASCS